MSTTPSALPLPALPSSPLLEEGTILTRTRTEATWLEGPVWLPSRRAVRVSDIPGDRILEVPERDGQLSAAADVVAEGVEFTNGRTLDLDGAVVECSHGRRAVQRDRAVSPGQSPAPRVVAERYGPHRLNSPNDVVVASDGSIWFSDPSYGIKRPEEGHAGEEEYGDRYVFRLDEEAGTVTPAVIDVEAPNGLAFSPDESLLYVADSSLSPADEQADDDRPRGHAIHVYDVVEGRHAKNGRIFAQISPGVPDGLRVDEHGNVWTSFAQGVQVLSPAAELLAAITLPERTSNLCFGGEDGRTLYITASSSVYRLRTTVRDAAAVRRQG